VTPHIRLVVVAMRQSLHEFPALVRLAHRFGIPEIFVQHLCHEYGEDNRPAKYLPMRAFVRAQSLLGEDPDRVARCFDVTRRLAEELAIELRLPSTRPRPHLPGTAGRERCDWAWRGAYVDFQGRALPCCMVSSADRIQLGNMAEKGAAPVWNGPAYQSFRAQLSSDVPPDVCRSCAIYQGTF
jgi:radical SAM protein with 4Fe4S-binding SPASM domain